METNSGSLLAIKQYIGKLLPTTPWILLVACITDPRAITGDTKAGTLIGTDRFGNKFYENVQEELPRKTDRVRD